MSDEKDENLLWGISAKKAQGIKEYSLLFFLMISLFVNYKLAIYIVEISERQYESSKEAKQDAIDFGKRWESAYWRTTDAINRIPHENNRDNDTVGRH